MFHSLNPTVCGSNAQMMMFHLPISTKQHALRQEGSPDFPQTATATSYICIMNIMSLLSVSYSIRAGTWVLVTFSGTQPFSTAGRFMPGLHQ